MIKNLEYFTLYILFFILNAEAGCIKSYIESNQVKSKTLRIENDSVLTTSQSSMIDMMTTYLTVIPHTTIGNFFFDVSGLYVWGSFLIN